MATKVIVIIPLHLCSETKLYGTINIIRTYICTLA